MPKTRILVIAAVASMLAFSPALAQTTPAPAPDQSAAPSDAMAKKPMKMQKAKHHKKVSKKKMEEKSM